MPWPGVWHRVANICESLFLCVAEKFRIYFPQLIIVMFSLGFLLLFLVWFWGLVVFFSRCDNLYEVTVCRTRILEVMGKEPGLERIRFKCWSRVEGKNSYSICTGPHCQLFFGMSVINGSLMWVCWFRPMDHFYCFGTQAGLRFSSWRVF